MDQHRAKKHSGKKRNPAEKKCPCEVCGKKFDCLPHLEMHTMLHTAEKPFECPTCHKKFRQKGYIKVHIRIVHEGEKRLICDVCGKGFGLSGSLKQHKRIHTGEKPYKCKFCSKKFSDNHSWKRHERTHGRKDGMMDLPQQEESSCLKKERNVYNEQLNPEECTIVKQEELKIEKIDLVHVANASAPEYCVL